MAKKVLVVDDEKLIVKGIRFSLLQDGMEVDCAYDGEEALNMAKANSYDMILLDVMLPKMDGFEVCQAIREFSDVPIVMLTAKGDDMDKILGLEYGADDYITKPFRPLIVGAKVKALIRRNKNQMNTTKDIIVCGDLKYDTTSLRFYKNNEEIELSSKENNLIFLFMKHPDQVFTKEMIYEHVWGNSIVVDDNTIMVYINRLRNKIEDNPQKPVHILTVRGVGYRFHA